MSRLSLPPLSGMPADVQAAFRSVAAWSAAQEKDVGVLVDAAVQNNTKTIIQKITASSASMPQTSQPVQQSTRPTLRSDFVLRSIISNSNMVAPIDLYSSVVFRAGNSETGVWIGAGGIGGSHGGIPTWAVSSQDGSFFFGKADSGYPADPAHKQIVFDASAGTFQFGKDIVVQTSAGPKTLDTISTASGYSTANLAADLAAGVGKVVSGIGGNYRLTVDVASGFITAAHKDAMYNAYSSVADTTNTRLPALALTAAGIAMGYNDVNGNWVNSVVVDAAAGTASFSGAINATSGNFTGTITAGSVIAASAMVNGVAIGTISANSADALSAATLAQSDAAAALAALPAKLGASSSYVLAGAVSVSNVAGGLKTGTITWDSGTGLVNGGSGVALTSRGLVGAAAGAVTFSIDATTGAATFAGPISASQVTSGTFSGVSINTTGAIWARGVTGTLANAAIVGEATGVGNHGVFGDSAAGYGVYGNSGSFTGGGFSGVSFGVYSSASSGTGVYGSGTTGVTGAGETHGVYSAGKFGTSSSAMVANLNAQYLGGYTAAQFSQPGHGHAGVYLEAGGTAANAAALGGQSAASFFRYTGGLTYAGSIGGRDAYWAEVSVNGASYKVLIS